jgi:hypothetical protein
MKAITLWNPWASLIAVGAKTYETRSWPTNHRGDIAIHAAKVEKYPGVDIIRYMRLIGLDPETLEYGKVLCIAEITDCIKLDCNTPTMEITMGEELVGDWSDGRYAWKLENIRVFDEPIPAKGMQGLWSWSRPATLIDSN